MPRIVEQENRIGTLCEDSFEPLSNFTIRYDVEVIGRERTAVSLSKLFDTMVLLLGKGLAYTIVIHAQKHYN